MSSQNTGISVYINHNNLLTKTSQENSALSYNAVMIKFHKCLSVKTLSRKIGGTFDRLLWTSSKSICETAKKDNCSFLHF